VIVVDASAMTEFLLQTPLGTRVEARLFRDGDDLHAPHLLDVEVVQALRRLVRAGDVPPDRAEEALDDLVG
jgi:predicted nucleic acid-binding protein